MVVGAHPLFMLAKCARRLFRRPFGLHALGLGAADVRVIQPDTAQVPNSGPTVASRTSMVVGHLVAKACDDLVRNLEDKGLLPAAAEVSDRVSVQSEGRGRRWSPEVLRAALGKGASVFTVHPSVPASTVKGCPSERWLMIPCSTSDTTTVRSGSLSSKRRNPSRTMPWSSAITTRIGTAELWGGVIVAAPRGVLEFPIQASNRSRPRRPHWRRGRAGRRVRSGRSCRGA